jgi:hypothetical protein
MGEGAANFMKKFTAMLLCFSLFFAIAGVMPAWAADAVEQSVLEIRLKSGSDTMTVNGESVKIQPPFEEKGTTMVPLRVITQTLGATLSLEGNTITLKHDGRTIRLTIGSVEVEADGQKSRLAAAPKVVNHVTMVPIRFIAQHFGATVTYNSSTKEVIIRAMVRQSHSGGPGGSDINIDAGYTKVGNSYYQWSIDYPAGLVQSSESSNGDWVLFTDAKEEYTLYVSVSESEDDLSKDELRKRVTELLDYDETIVDQRTVNAGDTYYVRITTKVSGGGFAENRGYTANGKFYFLYFYDRTAKNFKELSRHQSLLDSFQTSFDPADPKLKDLSAIVDGYRTVRNDDYGISVQIPADWTANANQLYFYNDEDQNLELEITSVEAGDTIEKWAERNVQLFLQTFRGDYIRKPESSRATVAGVPTVIYKLGFTLDRENWMTEYEVFLFKGDYKVMLRFAFPSEDAKSAEATFEKVLDTLTIDEAVLSDSFGFIMDEYDSIDMNKTVTKRNLEYKYSVTVPEYWTIEGSTEWADEWDFSWPGIEMQISADKSASMDEVVRFMESLYTSDSPLSDFTLIQNTTETKFGVTARKFVLKTSEDGGNGEVTQYIFEKNGITYLLNTFLLDAMATEENKQRLNDAINSFRFIE